MPSSPTPDTRQSLVDEGIRALLELTPELLISAVGAKEIARRSGVKVSTLYYHFGSLAQYADAVAAQVFDPAEFGVKAVLEGVSEVQGSGFPVEDGRAMHRAEFARVRDDPELRVRLGLWALGGTAMDQAYGDMLRIVDARIAASAEAIFATWGRDPSPPFDAQAFVAAHSALLSGSVVRHLVDPDGISVETFTRTAQALTMVMLRIKGDRRTLDDRLTEINYYPLRHRTAAPLSEGRARTKGRVLYAAAELFASEEYDQITIANIARSADASPST
ncbi:MAG: TetR/AcrR family transcriptional regulator, partial [Herbiconiux sp.]|nr:TetR/AcrR family transcriptional regulator [Herbiconiux sp.]